MRLRMLIDPNGKVPVKVVARTFASGKTEKLVYQCLADLGLSSGKVFTNKLLAHNVQKTSCGMFIKTLITTS